ncbi:hypothetical protein BDZ90DRAFT_274287 [Jaminaea rosea]|uniref:Uncharacterized protein n=1 Tax=Jaminaea rosea TaxID=1569628 RepID=A0A316UZQ5_9BASI|nr:hypothetical protein BDZ90DRAFT_274287 [Jaminaea rosea]PWN28655.1 hypothetical protein BDZ90DRAFT_274287 [Jaminaea rosea]
MSSNAARKYHESYVFKAQQDKLMSKQPRHASETKIVDGVQRSNTGDFSNIDRSQHEAVETLPADVKKAYKVQKRKDRRSTEKGKKGSKSGRKGKKVAKGPERKATPSEYTAEDVVSAKQLPKDANGQPIYPRFLRGQPFLDNAVASRSSTTSDINPAAWQRGVDGASPMARKIWALLDSGDMDTVRSAKFWLDNFNLSINSTLDKDGRPSRIPGAGVYLGMGIKNGRLAFIYVGRSGSIFYRFVDHLAQAFFNSSRGAKIYGAIRASGSGIFFPLFEDSSPQRYQPQAWEDRAIIEGLWAHPLGFVQEKEALLEARRTFGLPDIGDEVLGCNRTRCFEKPETYARKYSGMVRGDEVLFHLDRLNKMRRLCITATAFGEGLNRARHRARLDSAGDAFLDTLKPLMSGSSGLPIKIPSFSRLYLFFGISIPKIDAVAMQEEDRTSEEWWLVVESGGNSSMPSLTTPDRALFRGLALVAIRCRDVKRVVIRWPRAPTSPYARKPGYSALTMPGKLATDGLLFASGKGEMRLYNRLVYVVTKNEQEAFRRKMGLRKYHDRHASAPLRFGPGRLIESLPVGDVWTRLKGRWERDRVEGKMQHVVKISSELQVYQAGGDANDAARNGDNAGCDGDDGGVDEEEDARSEEAGDDDVAMAEAGNVVGGVWSFRAESNDVPHACIVPGSIWSPPGDGHCGYHVFADAEGMDVEGFREDMFFSLDPSDPDLNARQRRIFPGGKPPTGVLRERFYQRCKPDHWMQTGELIQAARIIRRRTVFVDANNLGNSFRIEHPGSTDDAIGILLSGTRFYGFTPVDDDGGLLPP